MSTPIRVVRLASLLALGALAPLGWATLAAAQAEPKQPTSTGAAGKLLTPQDLEALPRRAPDRRIAYGNSRQQYGELRVPAGRGPHPTAIIIHGGCFKAAYATADYAAPIGDALKDQGIASWNIEYRRLGDPGGGWPGTYRDVGRAVDYLRTLAKPYNLDLSRVVLVGHSAGGHLAMWAAGRSRVPKESALFTSLMGGTPKTRPERYAQASPIKLLPYGLPQVLVLGTHEDFVPMPLMRAYADAARRAGDSVRVVHVRGAGHFEVASPRSYAWPPVMRAIRALLDGRLPPVEPDSR